MHLRQVISCLLVALPLMPLLLWRCPRHSHHGKRCRTRKILRFSVDGAHQTLLFLVVLSSCFRFFAEEAFSFVIRESCPSALRVLDTQDLHFLRNGAAQGSVPYCQK